jgi:hypothetical protein
LLLKLIAAQDIEFTSGTHRTSLLELRSQLQASVEATARALPSERGQNKREWSERGKNCVLFTEFTQPGWIYLYVGLVHFFELPPHHDDIQRWVYAFLTCGQLGQTETFYGFRSYGVRGSKVDRMGKNMTFAINEHRQYEPSRIDLEVVTGACKLTFPEPFRAFFEIYCTRVSNRMLVFCAKPHSTHRTCFVLFPKADALVVCVLQESSPTFLLSPFAACL